MGDANGYPVSLFVLKPPDKLICPLCLDVLSNPHQCSNGHNYCLMCITRSLEVFNTCPLCKEPLELNKLSKNLFLDNLIEELEVNCNILPAAMTDVCHWRGSLHSREAHIHRCQFHLPIVCPFPVERCRENCPRLFSTRELLQIHLIECIDLKTNELARFKQRSPQVALNTRAYTTREFPASGGRQPAIYSGCFLNGVRHGWGVFEIFGGPEASLYAGEFVGDLANGQGFKKSKTHTYNGMWKDGLMHGLCFEFTRPDGVSGEGEFANNCLEGYAKVWSENGEGKWCYEGEFHNDKRHGPGKLTFPNGKQTFIGIFVDGVASQGMIRFNDDDDRILSGTFNEKIECNGKGLLLHSTEVIYEGDFEHNKFHGFGVAHIPDGSLYRGAFVEGKRHGRGIMTFADKSEYRGQFSQDEIHGEGVLVSANGEVGVSKIYSHGVVDHNKIVFDLMDDI